MDKASQRSFIAILIALLITGGVAIAGSQGGSKINEIPIYVLCFVLAFMIQWVAFIPAFLKQTEAFYDLTGSITFISVMVVAVLLSPKVDSRSVLLVILVLIWAVRLGSFLFTRIRAAGEDRRFREIKPSFARFLLAWTLQGMWVAFSLAAALAVITSQIRVELDIFALVGVLIWVLGFGFEVVADLQKSKFRASPQNAGKFVNVGLWSYSRHPNYFGEIVLWIGVAVIALPVLRGWQWLTLISPVFITILLTRISGIPMLETRADEKWGGQADYEEYKAKTSILIPLPPSKRV